MIIITGDGKGKTTSALGMAVRAAGWNKKSVIIHFLKPKKSGEAFVNIPHIKQYWLGSDKFVINPTAEDKKNAEKGLEIAKHELNKKPFLLILDEITHAINLGLISSDDVLKLANKQTTIVVTGRNAPKKLIEKANLVSEIKNIKHPFDKGKAAKKGIEY